MVPFSHKGMNGAKILVVGQFESGAVLGIVICQAGGKLSNTCGFVFLSMGAISFFITKRA
jgi:hypothetical protein